MAGIFGSKRSHEGETTLIAPGTCFEGNIRFRGVLEIEGTVVGDISSPEDPQALVRVLQSGEVSGSVEVPLVVINGSVNGNIVSSDHVQLAEHAKVDGDVFYNLIEMVKGAHINGKLVFREPGSGPPTVARMTRLEPGTMPEA